MHNPKNSIQDTNIVFNHSDIELTPAMLKILNRALNFAILPLKLDITQILVDYNRFARTAIWQEYWFGRDTDEAYTEPIFRKRKK